MFPILCLFQDEVVTFTTTIYPIDAKGMVEKWLLQVSHLSASQTISLGSG